MLVVMVCGRQLDQSLQKRLLRLGFDEPYLFPDFMRFEKPSRIEMR